MEAKKKSTKKRISLQKPALVKLKYIGPKNRMPVLFPIGHHNPKTAESVVYADPFIELKPEDAKKLLDLNKHGQNLEVVKG